VIYLPWNAKDWPIGEVGAIRFRGAVSCNAFRMMRAASTWAMNQMSVPHHAVAGKSRTRHNLVNLCGRAVIQWFIRIGAPSISKKASKIYLMARA
jgi:hypothetical protein